MWLVFKVLIIALAVGIPLLITALYLLAQQDEKYAKLLYKLEVVRKGYGHIIFSADKRMPSSRKTPSNGGDYSGFNVESSKTVFFVRHAESAWNDIFNKGFNASFPKRLLSALHKEYHLFPTLDSVFLDAPLSQKGAEDVLQLRDFLESDNFELKDTVRGIDTSRTVLACSNLRRAALTETIGFWHRLQRTKEKIHVLSCLQEVTFNVDGFTLSQPHSPPEFSEVEVGALGFNAKEEFIPEEYYNCNENHGNKQIQSSGFKRIVQFCEWCFHENQSGFDNIVASGHSTYFRYFFRYFLDTKLPGNSHFAKKGKMKNCSVVKFELQKGTTKDGLVWYRIPEETLEVLHLGFELKGSKTKKE